MIPHRVLLAIAVAFALFLTACSDDADDAQTGDPSDSPEAPASSTTTEATTTTTEAASTTTTDAPTTTTTEPEPSGPQPPVVYELVGDAVFPEGMEYDPATDTLYASGSESGPIHRIDRATGEATVWATSGDEDCVNSHGLAVDAERGLLWVAGQSGSFVKALDLADGSMVACVALGPGGFVNDLDVAADGTVYVTDSSLSTITAVTGDPFAGELTAEVIADTTSLGLEPNPIGTNGIIADPDGTLIIAHTALGALLRLDPATGEVTRITIDGVTDGGVPFTDGLMQDGDTLWSVAGTGVHRLEFSGPNDATTAEVLTDPSFGFPTTGVLIDGTRLAVANSQFNARTDLSLPFTVTEIDAFGS